MNRDNLKGKESSILSFCLNSTSFSSKEICFAGCSVSVDAQYAPGIHYLCTLCVRALSFEHPSGRACQQPMAGMPACLSGQGGGGTSLAWPPKWPADPRTRIEPRHAARRPARPARRDTRMPEFRQFPHGQLHHNFFETNKQASKQTTNKPAPPSGEKKTAAPNNGQLFPQRTN